MAERRPLIVKDGQIEEMTSGDTIPGSVSPIPAGGTTGQVLKKVDGTDYNFAWADETGGGGGATAFTGLSDVPSSYSSQGLKGVRVNAAENALEFYTIGAATNGLPSGGTAGQVLEKIDGTDYNTQWVDPTNHDQVTTTTYTTVDADHLNGRVVKKMNNASAITVTVAPSLTNKEPCTFIQEGAGTVTFAAGSGVTIHSADGNLSTRVQYSAATLIPDHDNADTFFLVGDLTT